MSVAGEFELDIEAHVPDLQRLLSLLSPSRLAGAMKNVGEAGVGLATESFQTGKDPDGAAWPALQESTLEAFVGKAAGRRRRRSYGTRPLIRTATLMRSLRWELRGNDAVAVGTAQAHGVYHQGDPDHASRGIVPPRRFLPERGRELPDAWRSELLDAVESYLASGG